MSQQPGRKITKTERIDASGSRIKVTRMEQDIDDTHIVIQSSIPGSEDHANSKQSPISLERAKYFIEIEEDDSSNIDLRVNLGQTPLIRSNRKFQTQSEGLSKPTNTLNQQSSRSRIRIESSQEDQFDYEVKYSSQRDDSRGEKRSDNRNYQTCITQTFHTIKIRGNHLYSPPLPYPYSSHYERNYASQTQAIPIREEKSFGDHNLDGRNREGRIIRNGESNKSIRENEKNLEGTQDQSKNAWMKKDANDKRDNKMQKIQLMQNQQRNSYDQESKKRQKNQWNSSSGRQSAGTGEEYSHKKPQTIGRQIRTQPRTPKSTQRDEEGSLSPIVHEYAQELQTNLGHEHDPIFIDEQYQGYRRQRTLKNKYEFSVVSQFQNFKPSAQQEAEKQRVPPVPYEKKTALQKKLEKELDSNEWPPSIKDIPVASGAIRRHNGQGARDEARKTANSPIVVPIQKIPKSYTTRYNTEVNHGPTQQVKRVKISLSTSQNQTGSIRQNSKSGQKDDIFAINKQKYLDKLRRSERSRSRLENSRTFSRTSRHSLSPECEQITNRLHATRINKQPCPKFVRYNEQMKRLEMKETLGEYTFIRRYLTDHEIWQILTQFELEGVPQKKWPIRLVDIVYDKLRAMKVY